MKLRRITVVGGSIVSAALLLAATSWACTPSGVHNGVLWFCSTSSGCLYTSRVNPTVNTTAYVRAAGLDTQNGSYDIRVRSGQDATQNCKLTTDDLGTIDSQTASTDTSGVGPLFSGWGWTANEGESLDTTGSYEICATMGTLGNPPSNNDLTSASVETNFSVVSN